MNAIEIHDLTKSFRGMYALDHFCMHVPVGAIYGFIGENGSGKSTTMKLICGHLVADSGNIRLFDRPSDHAGVRAKVGALIENAGCFPNASVYQNLRMQTINLGLEDPEGEIHRVLTTVRMQEDAHIKFKNCSLGMKQRIGIAMALLGSPSLLILDEPINGLDADGMRLMREILTDITKNCGCTVLISSHILGELEKIATHYGIIRQGKMVMELSAKQMEERAQVFVRLKTADMQAAYRLLAAQYPDVRFEGDYIFVYREGKPEKIVKLLMQHGHPVSEIEKNKIGLEEYYIELMSKKEVG